MPGSSRARQIYELRLRGGSHRRAGGERTRLAGRSPAVAEQGEQGSSGGSQESSVHPTYL